jgi:hypothetical protein
MCFNDRNARDDKECIKDGGPPRTVQGIGSELLESSAICRDFIYDIRDFHAMLWRWTSERW